MIKKIFTLLCLCTLCIGSAWGKTVTFDFKELATATSGTVDGIGWGTGKTGSASATVCNTTNGLVLYGVSGGGGYFNTTSPTSGNITGVVLVTTAKKNTPKYTAYGSTDGKNWTTIEEGIATGNKNLDLSSASYTYFKIQNTTGTTAQLGVTSIAITFEVSEGSHLISTVVDPENAGSITLGSATVAEGATTTATANENDHFTFTGWSISGEGSTLSSTTDNPTTITMGTKDATITANFTEDAKYDVTFNANDGLGVMEGVSVYAGDYTLPECDFTKTGYKFIGWKANNAGELIAVGSSYTITNTAVEFYAQWEETTDINVTYNFKDANSYPTGFPTGGTNVAVAERFMFGENELIINAPTSYYQINPNNDNSRALFFGKSATNKSEGAYLEFPAKAGYKLAKVTATTGSGVAGSVVFNIYDTSWNAKSANCTTIGSTSKEFNFSLSSPNENEAYRLAASTKDKNLQFFSIVLTYEKVATITRTITAAKYATLGLPYAVTIPENVSAYTATVSGNTVTLSKINKEGGSNVIPANCGVILYADVDVATTYTFKPTSDVAPITGNKLFAVVSGTYYCVDDYGRDYYLGKDTDEKATFIKLAQNGTIPAGKAYLKLDNALPSGAKLDVVFGDEPTGIKDIQGSKMNTQGSAYNLNGVRVNENYKGIVIMNGKKYINK
ncbi:MAG: InlB B-repeat-containing protein [Bacteroidaceae bacterium]|nr:InlB B-repeat-containing protein [Bacteroidaceae bacterium]